MNSLKKHSKVYDMNGKVCGSCYSEHFEVDTYVITTVGSKNISLLWFNCECGSTLCQRLPSSIELKEAV